MIPTMNKLPTAKRAQILALLVDGLSVREVARATGASTNTVAKLLIDAGAAAAAYHDEHVQDIAGRRHIKCREIWSFAGAGEKARVSGTAPLPSPADVWTFTGMDQDSRLLVAYLVSSERDRPSALAFLTDLRGRLKHQPKVAAVGGGALADVAGAGDMDQAQVAGKYGKDAEDRHHAPPVVPRSGGTGTEHRDLAAQASLQRFTRLAAGATKKTAKYVAMLSLYFTHYNFCKVHTTLQVTPAMAAALSDTVWDLEWLVALADARAPKPNRPKTYRKRAANPPQPTQMAPGG